MKYPFHGKCCLAAVLALLLLIAFAAAETVPGGDDGFYAIPITDEIFARIEGKSYAPGCTVPREDLRYLHLLHVDLDGEVHEGEMIVNYHIADDMLEIFRTLFEAGFPIEKIRLIDDYGADDELSMADNNTSAFNFRFIIGTTRPSKHGLGLAVDINPLYNPHVWFPDGEMAVEPAAGIDYLNRQADFPYKMERWNRCYWLFLQHGFEWGGDWDNSRDYQHFEISDELLEKWYPRNPW